MPESFGARLRQRREQRGIALVTIAEQTKIKLSLLEALERDDVSHWPSGIFRRSFVRDYAHAIGLNPDAAVREFLEIYPDPTDVPTASPIASDADGARLSGGPPTRLHYLVGSAMNSLSRLRRSAAVEEVEVVAADSGAVSVAAPPPSDPPAAAHSSSETDRSDTTNDVVAGRAVSREPGSTGPDFLAVARLCTEFGRVESTTEVQPLLEEAARILDATGLIIWVWDRIAAELRPALAHGYSNKVLGLLPIVTRDADNATAAAFRSGRACAIDGSDRDSGALVVPLLTPAGCGGVLAIELRHGSEPTESRRAAATILAAQLAQLIADGRSTESRPRAEVTVPAMPKLATPALRVTRRR